MIYNIGFVDTGTLQDLLDTQIGPNIFTVGIDHNTTPKQCYLEYADNTPQSQLDQAIIISDEQVLWFLNQTKVRLYESLESTAARQITLLKVPNFTALQRQAAADWLNNQSLPVPSCVLYLSIDQGISNAEAAQKIVESDTSYNQAVEQIGVLKAQGQAAVMNATEVYPAKTSAADYTDQIKNVSN